MKTLHHCRSCGYLSTASRSFKRIGTATDCWITVCDACENDYGTDVEVTRWVDEGTANDELKESCEAALD